MRRKLGRTCLIAILSGGFAFGCGQPALSPHTLDPLLVSKKPVEAKPEKATPTLVAQAEPAAPTLPATVLASKPTRSTDASAQNPAPTRPPVQATPAVRSGRSTEVPAAPAVERRE